MTDTQKTIESLGRKVSVYTADLSSPEDVRKVVPAVLADGHKIRILINCAGIQIRHACEVFPDDDFNKVSKHSYPIVSYSLLRPLAIDGSSTKSGG